MSSEAHNQSDRCRYCLRYEGVSVAIREGVRFCPTCGADWEAVNTELPELEAGQDPFAIEDSAPPQPTIAEPLGTPPPRVIEQLPELTTPPPDSSRPPYGPVAMGVLLGLLATITVALVFDYFSTDPEPAAQTIVVQQTLPPPPPAEPPPVIEPPQPKTPDPIVQATRLKVAVEQAIQRSQKALPASAVVNVGVRVETGIAYLSGQIDGRATRAAIVQAAGKVFGIKAVDTRDLQVVFRRHTVMQGDTLGKLAEHYYGDSRAWKTIQAANPALGQTKKLNLGQILLIPDDAGEAEDAPPSSP